VEAGVDVVDRPFAASGNVATAGGCMASQYLAAWVIARLAGMGAAAEALRYVAPVGEKEAYVAPGARGSCARTWRPPCRLNEKSRSRDRFRAPCKRAAQAAFASFSSFSTGSGRSTSSTSAIGGVVAHAEAELEDAQVPAVAILVARSELVEELHDDLAVAQRSKARRLFASVAFLPSVMMGSATRRSSFAFGSVVLIASCFSERDGHVAQHREAMAAGAVELSQPMAVTHCYFPFTLLAYSALLVLWLRSPMTRDTTRATGRHLVNPATGQFSSFMPSVRPFDASTSLISFSDLRPRFGVFSSSFSVRWMRSPM
jgi:hypothetical protein